jgi:hypothetical protein
LAHGFFEEVIARLPEKGIGEAVRVAVAAKFASMRTRGSQEDLMKKPILPSRLNPRSLKEEEVLDVRALQGLGK